MCTYLCSNHFLRIKTDRIGYQIYQRKMINPEKMINDEGSYVRMQHIPLSAASGENEKGQSETRNTETANMFHSSLAPWYFSLDGNTRYEIRGIIFGT